MTLSDSTGVGVDPPRQLAGSAAGRAHLTGPAATDLTSEPVKQDSTAPRDALPRESRHKSSGQPATGGLLKPPPLPEELTGTAGDLTGLDADRPAASAEARKTGDRVLVESATTESSLTYANADGTFTTEMSTGINRVRRDGDWVPVDTSLVGGDGGGDKVLRAKAGKADVEFSAGGDAAPLARMSLEGGESVDFTWPEPLPKPVVKGSKATYVDAAGENADLVLTMLPGGFTQDVVLRERPDGPVKVSMDVEGEGLVLTENAGGGLDVTSEAGRVVARAARPFMYDSSGDEGEHGDVAEIDTTIVEKGGRQTLVLEPDPEFLADPDTEYPVTVDPTVTRWSGKDTYVYNNLANTTHDGMTQLQVGESSSSWAYRSLIEFDLPNLWDATVTEATLEVAHLLSPCATMTAKRLTGSFSFSTTWNNQPTVTSTGSATSSNAACPYSRFNVASIVQAWADGASNYGFQLSKTSASAVQTLRSEESGIEPVLSITYAFGSAPAVPTPSVAPQVEAENGGVITSLTPVISAPLSDPDGGTLQADFEVRVGGTTVWENSASGVASGGTATVAVPSGELSDGQTMEYRVRATDGTNTSSWSSWIPARVTSMPVASLSFVSYNPIDNTQVGSLTPALSAYAKAPGEAATNYWYQVCEGTPGNWIWCEASTWVKGSWTVPPDKLKWGRTYYWYSQAATTATTSTSPWRTFTTTPEQATINSLLAEGTDGREFDHVTGNYTTAATDVSIPTVGPPLSVTRTYNSLDPRTDGVFGAGWTSRWDTRLVNEPRRNTVLITYPDGRQWRFAEKPGGGYAAPEGMYATLATQSGGGWRLMDKESTSYWFDSAGRLTQVTDHRGRSQTLTYTAGKLSKVTATGGRSLNFGWTGDHITSVSTDPVGGTVTPPASATDAFTRTVTGGLGTADVGGTYTATGSAANYSVDGGGAKLAMPATGANRRAYLPALALTTSDMTFSVGSDKAATGNGIYLWGIGRSVAGQGDYRVRARLLANGSVVLAPSRVDNSQAETLLATETTVSGLTHTAGTPLKMRVKVSGTSPTTVQAKIWPASGSEPGSWQVTATDGTAALQTAGGIGFGSYLSGTSTNAPVVVTVDDLNVTNGGSGGTGGTTGTPLTWTYTYTGDLLTKVCAPGAGTQCTTYEYGNDSRYRSAVMDSGPRGYWRLNETAGALGTTVTNEVGTVWRVGHAKIAGATADLATGIGAPLEETDDKAMRFEGTAGSSYVSLPSGAVNGQGGDVSLETWFRTTASGTIFGYQNSAGSTPTAYTPAIYVGTDGKLRGQFWTGTAAPITTTGTVNDGQWHHVVLAGARNTQSLYLDGQLVGSLSAQIAHLGQWDARIGSGFGSASWPFSTGSSGVFGFDGDIDEFAFYGKHLSTEEVQTHWTTKNARRQITKITTPSGRVWAQNTYRKDGGRLLTHTDKDGGQWELSNPVDAEVSDTQTTRTTTVTDPHDGTLVYVADPWRGSRLISAKDQLNKTVSYEYDTGGYLSEITDRNGNVSRQQYNPRGNLVGLHRCRSVGNCSWEWVEYEEHEDQFDPRNDQPSVRRDARSASATDDTYATTWTYNTHGEMVSETRPTDDGPGLTLTYTDGTEAAVGGGTVPAGLLKKKVDAEGGEWTYRQNASGDLAEETNPTGLVTTYTYDAIGRQTTQTEISDDFPSGNTTTIAYDARGRVATRTEPAIENEITGVTHTGRTTYTYDPDGRPLTETASDLTGGDAPRQTTFAYDDYGRVETTTDPEGGVREYAWNHRGAQVLATNEVGTRLAYTYTSRGQLATEVLKDWTGSPTAPQPAADVVLLSYAYDNNGRLSSQTDAIGRTTRYTYFTDDLIAEKIADDAHLNGSSTPRDVVLESLLYDAAGNPTRVTTGGGKTRADYEVDESGRVTSITLDPTGLARKTVMAYDGNDNVVSVTKTGGGGPQAEVTTYEYDAANRRTKSTVENGADDLVTTVAYGDRGFPTESTSPGGHTTEFRYDLAGRLVEQKQPSVNVERNGAAPVAHRPSIRYAFNTYGDQTHATDPEGRTTVSAFDKAGRNTSIAAPSYTRPGGTAVTPTATITYDDAGRPVDFTDVLGATRVNTYDALGNLVRVTDPPATTGATAGRTDFTYTLTGERLSQTNPVGGRTEATYDDLGRQITTTVIDRYPAAVTLVGHAEYDDAGNLISEQRPTGDTSEAEVNAFGEITELTDALGKITAFGYDLAGRQTTVTDPLGNQTATAYDLAGRPTSIANKDDSGTVLRTRALSFDLDGHPTGTVDAEGHTHTAAYDALGRLTQMVEPVSAGQSITTSFGYDAAGAQTRYTDGRGNATITTYNTLGLVESVIEPATAAYPNAGDRTWTTGYDANGNAVTQSQPGGVVISRTFDNLGRLTGQTGSGGGSATTEAKTFGYDLAGRVTSAGDLTFAFNDRGALLRTTKAGVDQATFAYDANGRLTQRADAAGAASFTWDGDNRLTTATDPLTGVTVSYGYDDADRRTGATYGTGGPQRTYSYDDLNRLTGDVLKTGAGAPLASISYGYDAEDRLTSKATSGTAGAGANSYTYDHSGRLTSWTAPTGTTAYEWDAAGNRTRAGADTFTYDQRNRLTSGAGTDYTYTPRGTQATATKGALTTTSTFDAFDRMITDGGATYIYDALDRMTTRTQSGTTAKYVYGGTSNDLTAVTDAAGAVQELYNRDATGALLSSKTGAATAQFQLTDHHRDVVAGFTAGATSLSGSTSYDPFGTVLATGGARPQLGYQGSWTDPASGKSNMASRWYQPGTGTFASRDTMTLAPAPSGRANRYAYGLGSPLTMIDPSGHAPKVPSKPVPNVTIDADGVCRGTLSNCDAYFNPPIPDLDLGGGFGIDSSGTCHGDFNKCVKYFEGNYWENLADAYVPIDPRMYFNEDMARELGVMENGKPLVEGVPYWGMNEDARMRYLAGYNPSMSDEEHFLAALDAMAETNDFAGLDWMLSGLPSGGKGVKGKDVAKAWKAQKKLDTELEHCRYVLSEGKHKKDSECQRRIEDAWEEWRSLFCGNSIKSGPCRFSVAATWLSEATGMPKALYEFLGSTMPWISYDKFEERLIAWAEKQGGYCHDAPRNITICSNLVSGVHFGRGATTLGSVILTAKPYSRISQILLNHEYVHTKQFHDMYAYTNYWPTFLVFYLNEPLWDPCDNRYEKEAERAGNTYTC
ncbi:DNRLRE domain-containing protein [Herbidospora galbida]|uniref:DNRLRE domain-containing protein n=1 Tax=Herbidospora galbida TaxID=2575442 RepID=UPI00148594A4|nr:DNRLRE domain-containing protein [Herbidospora galbida]